MTNVPAEALRALRELVDAMIHDHAKYPNLALPTMQMWRVKRMQDLLASVSALPQAAEQIIEIDEDGKVTAGHEIAAQIPRTPPSASKD